MSTDFYTWPSAFPFRLYLNRPECRIFIIETISHNYNWFKEINDKIKETDYFFVIMGWNFNDTLATAGKKMIEELRLDINNFFLMHNSLDEMARALEYGFRGDFINHNAWLDEDKFKILDCPKKYDALYVARRIAVKRHYLASGIKNLALAAGGWVNKNEKVELPICKNDPNKYYNRTEIVKLINESSCGLCLSEVEGACFSSSEYLLCGVPVVSTPSKGGRDIWYNINNSILTEPKIESVSKAVELIKQKQFCPQTIREEHIKKMSLFRGKFVQELAYVFDKYGIKDECPMNYFKNNFFEKMRKDAGGDINNIINLFKYDNLSI
tara:strand:- start:321 stop:1295 length:975 start_codon:yes stop_codon:yes gene_type:complete